VVGRDGNGAVLPGDTRPIFSRFSAPGSGRPRPSRRPCRPGAALPCESVHGPVCDWTGSPFNQGVRELSRHHSWIRNSPWIPRMAWQGLTDSQVAVARCEDFSLEPAPVAALAVEQKSCAAATPPRFIIEGAVADQRQSIQVPLRPAAWRTTIEDRVAAAAWHRPADAIRQLVPLGMETRTLSSSVRTIRT
jgi:hypothetical protein